MTAPINDHTAEFDPAEVEQWALNYLRRLSQSGRRGVLLGGSIARGQQWAHSDLEAGLLVEAHDPALLPGVRGELKRALRLAAGRASFSR